MKKSSLLIIPFLLLSSSYSAAESVDALQARITKLERMSDNRGLLNILDEVQILQKEVRELRGQVEQQAYTIEQLKKRNQNLYDDLDQRLQGQTPTEQSVQVIDSAAVESTASQVIEPTYSTTPDVVEQSVTPQEVVIETSQTSAPSVSSTIKPVETYVAKSGQTQTTTAVVPSNTQATQQTNSVDPSAEASYSEAFNLLKLGKNDIAITKFRQFLETYPNNQYSDNSQYWLGEAFYAKRQFTEAIQEYKRLLSNYPDSGKASHAQLKLGYSYNEMGQNDFAQGELEDLIARYPGTSAARLAEDRLNIIRSQ